MRAVDNLADFGRVSHQRPAAKRAFEHDIFWGLLDCHGVGVYRQAITCRSTLRFCTHEIGWLKTPAFRIETQMQVQSHRAVDVQPGSRAVTVGPKPKRADAFRVTLGSGCQLEVDWKLPWLAMDDF